MRGQVHSIQSMGAVDGPGIRFVVFLQGCPLRCAYCHNPDTWAYDAGMSTEAEALVQQALRYKPYFGQQGGATVSGGEPLCQAAFVTELFELLHAQGIHTCLDTSGALWNDDVQTLLKHTDHCLLDIKMSNETDYLRHTGSQLTHALHFLQQLEEQDIPTWVRQVIVPGINDTDRNIEALNEIVRPYRCVERVELLAFETLCLEKYEAMGIPFPLAGTPPMQADALAQLQNKIERTKK